MDGHAPARGAAVLGFHESGGGPYTLTAPVQPAQAASLVAAFNGGFLMKDAQGGYYTEGRAVYPLVDGAASLVVYSDGSVNVGAWGSDVTMTPDVVAVRQNLVPLVEDGQPTARANADWHLWGSTCGATSSASTVPGLEYQWRSSVGITADGTLVHVSGPALSPPQLADLLVHAGVVRGMDSTSTRAGRSSPRTTRPHLRSSPHPRTGTAWSRRASKAPRPSSTRPGPTTS